MKKHLYFALLTLCAVSLHASVIDIPRGGYSIEADVTAKATFKTGYDNPPDNLILPRVIAKNFFLDSVFWKAPSDATLQSILQDHPKDSKFKITQTKPFVTSSGLKCLRYELEHIEPGKRNLHRLLFRNSENQVICVGMFSEADIADKIFASITLIKPIKVEQGAAANP